MLIPASPGEPHRSSLCGKNLPPVACPIRSAVKQRLLRDSALISSIARICELSLAPMKRGNKLLLFGNGGSAAGAQHISAEFSGEAAHRGCRRAADLQPSSHRRRLSLLTRHSARREPLVRARSGQRFCGAAAAGFEIVEDVAHEFQLNELEPIAPPGGVPADVFDSESLSAELS